MIDSKRRCDLGVEIWEEKISQQEMIIYINIFHRFIVSWVIFNDLCMMFYFFNFWSKKVLFIPDK